jgi:hypothetical protein
MRPKVLREYFQKQIDHPKVLSNIIAMGILSAANDPQIEEPRENDLRLFFYKRHLDSRLDVQSVWLSELDSFAENVNHGDFPIDSGSIPYLYL